MRSGLIRSCKQEDALRGQPPHPAVGHPLPRRGEGVTSNFFLPSPHFWREGARRAGEGFSFFTKNLATLFSFC
jgi:hypothetical protein